LSDTANSLLNLLLLTCGFALIVPWTGHLPLWRFLLGTGIASFGFAISQVEITSIFSQLQTETSQGTMMGFLTAGGSLARMLGPVWSASIYHKDSFSLIFLLLTASSGLAFLIIFLLSVTHKLHLQSNKFI